MPSADNGAGQNAAGGAQPAPLPFLPERPPKPRDAGVTMVMDKGPGVREAEDFAATAGHIVDYVKFGFGAALVARGAKEMETIRLGRRGDTFLDFLPASLSAAAGLDRRASP